MNQHIKQALLNGRLVLLLGAGASIGCRNSINEDPPLGWDLGKILSNVIGHEFEEEDDLSDIYAASKKTLGSQLQNLFEKYYKHCTPSAEYQILARYPFFRIYTLNIDDGFERAMSRLDKRKFNVKKRNDDITDQDQFFQTLDLIKLNGDVNNPSDGYIFSTQEYAKGSATEPLWYSELARDYHRYTFIFIGTKLKEPLFSHQVEKYKTKTGSTDLKSYILIPSLSEMKKQALEASNIHHLKGTLKDFTDWLESAFDKIPTGQDIVVNTRPELTMASQESDSHRISLFSGVTPVSRAVLALLDKKIVKDQIREFYKGFKPTWFDIVDEVPAFFYEVQFFFNSNLKNNAPNPLDFYVLFGSAGCGKSTALKQIALKLADEGERNVYFIDGHKDNFVSLIRELDDRNKDPYYIVIERIGDVAIQVAEIIKSGSSDKAIFISSENPKIWRARVREHLEEFITCSTDVSHISEQDAPLILEKLEKYGNWTRLSKMSERNRKLEILKKSKRQLLIGLIEATSGEGYSKIIQKDYKSITCDSERALLLLAGLATTERLPANESTLTRAMLKLGKNPNIHYVASQMDGVVSYSNGNVTTRHRVYIDMLFKMYVSKDDILEAIIAYISAFAVYKSPIAKNISKNESSIYKHLVNAKFLKGILNNDKDKILSLYKMFEKTFEHEGLFLMQYGLALRSFNENEDAFEKLRVAFDAYPESPHIEHALAQQRIILACQTQDEIIALAQFAEAEAVLNRLHSSKLNAYDRYPIITLSEGHVKLMVSLAKIPEAKIIAKQYHDRIGQIRNSKFSSRLAQASHNLSKFYVSGIWPDSDDDVEEDVLPKF